MCFVYILQTLKANLVANGLGNVQLVVSDNGWDVSRDVRATPIFADVVGAIGSDVLLTY